MNICRAHKHNTRLVGEMINFWEDARTKIEEYNKREGRSKTYKCGKAGWFFAVLVFHFEIIDCLECAFNDLWVFFIFGYLPG